MSDELNKVFVSAVEGQEQAMGLMKKLMAVASPRGVFSEPTTSGDYTVITASEVAVGMGFGYGIGGGTGPESAEGEAEGEGQEQSEGQEGPGAGVGGGGGGGGFSAGRPVAAISIGPGGVQVEPIVDPTKIALAFFTTLGTMFLMRRKMRQGG